MPSPRERDRASIRWTLFERLVYTAAAPWAGDWFFYNFLARRLQRRRLMSVQIRERAFQTVTSFAHLPVPSNHGGPIRAASHPVR